MIRLNLDYIRNGTFMTFLWRPKAYFTNLRNNPVVLLPLAIILILLIVKGIIDFLKLPASIAINIFTYHLTFTPIFSVVTLSLTTLYFFVIFMLAKNKQSFQLVFSVVLHAFLASMYGLIVFDVIQIILVNLTEDIGKVFKLSNLAGLLFFAYLGVGLKWGLSISNGQFLFAFITFILLIILIIITLIVIAIFILFAFLNDVSEAITQFFRVLGFKS